MAGWKGASLSQEGSRKDDIDGLIRDIAQIGLD